MRPGPDYGRCLQPLGSRRTRSIGFCGRRWERQHFGEYLDGTCSFAEQRHRRLRSLLAALDSVSEAADLDELFALHDRHAEVARHLFDDVGPALRDLRRHRRHLRLGVLTNGNGPQRRAKLRQVGLGQALDVVVASSELGVAKPAAAAFLEACDRLGTVPSATIHVGDNLRIDAEGPTVAGLVAVWLQRDRQSAGGVRLAIASLRQLPRLLADITVAR